MNNSERQFVSFIDASGTFSENDRFFGVGMLTVPSPGIMTDKLQLIFQRVLAISQIYRNQRLDSLIAQNNFVEAIKMLKKTKRFELKFDRLSPVKFDQYKKIINIFLENDNSRFAVMIIDRKHSNYNSSFFKTTWGAYTSYLSTLVARELINLSDKEMFLVLDELPKPKNIKESLECVVLNKINRKCLNKYRNQKTCLIKGAIRIESHSNLLMQLCDILLGCVMFDYKQSAGILSEKLQKRKEEVVSSLRIGLNKQRLDQQFTVHKPVYFHVWNAVWQ